MGEGIETIDKWTAIGLAIFNKAPTHFSPFFPKDVSAEATLRKLLVDGYSMSREQFKKEIGHTKGPLALLYNACHKKTGDNTTEAEGFDPYDRLKDGLGALDKAKILTAYLETGEGTHPSLGLLKTGLAPDAAAYVGAEDGSSVYSSSGSSGGSSRGSGGGSGKKPGDQALVDIIAKQSENFTGAITQLGALLAPPKAEVPSVSSDFAELKEYAAELRTTIKFTYETLLPGAVATGDTAEQQRVKTKIHQLNVELDGVEVDMRSARPSRPKRKERAE